MLSTGLTVRLSHQNRDNYQQIDNWSPFKPFTVNPGVKVYEDILVLACRDQGRNTLFILIIPGQKQH